MCDSVRPHRRQPTRLPHPWDSPGKNTGVGCHCLLQCMKVKSQGEVAQSCPTQQPHGLQPTRLLQPWGFPGKSTGVGCHCLLQMEYYSVLKRHKPSSHEKTQRNSEWVILPSKGSPCGKTLSWGLQSLLWLQDIFFQLQYLNY